MHFWRHNSCPRDAENSENHAFLLELGTTICLRRALRGRSCGKPRKRYRVGQDNPPALCGSRCHARRLSHSSHLIIPWTLESAGEVVQIVPPTRMIVHDLASQIELALRGLGIVNAPAAYVAGLLESRRLSQVLPSWSCPQEAVYLYFPSRRHQSAALRAFMAFLKTADFGDASR
ncbi:LysR substrate-binding domain-containing protein [Pseudomonas sp. NFACC37-1]|uniref:LysR substrate-binding domain-containing protein n=1 Tax=Pseudomonas sp. NFACC37-1 TaxID=1566196 RepID=UPI000B81590F